MGSKRAQKIDLNPGPGQYDIAIADLVVRPQTAKANAFNMTKRPDLWKDEKSKGNALGPAYENVRSSFDQSKKKGSRSTL